MIVIIGGGIFGLMSGWYLARAGQAVTLVERNHVGQGTTRSAAGMLMPWKLSKSFRPELFALQQASYARWPTVAEELRQQTGLDLDYRQDGRLFIATHDNAAQRLYRQYEYHHQLGLPVEWLSLKQARRLEPSLSNNVLQGIYAPHGHWIDNRQVIVALKQVFQQVGGILREQCQVDEILWTEARVRGVRVSSIRPDRFLKPVRSSETLTAKTVIVAAGPWSGTLGGLPDGYQQVVKPRKGQWLVLQMSETAPIVNRCLLGPVYLVPRTDGRLIIGTTVEREAGFDTQSTASGVYFMLHKARTMVPAIDDLPLIELGAGLRPTSPNRQPVIGPSHIPGLIFATGGHSHGILLAPIVAETIEALIMRGQVAPIIAPFTP